MRNQSRNQSVAVRKNLFCNAMERTTEIPPEDIYTQSHIGLVHWGAAIISL